MELIDDHLTKRLDADRFSPAQRRVVAAALDLFGEHGVGGTSLQMIADAIGVTKAAVYHQFNTKDEIVIAAIEVELTAIEEALDAAEADGGVESRDLVLARVIELAVARRRMVSAIQHDPIIGRHLSHHEPFREVMQRLSTVLTGNDTGVDARVRAAMAAAAIGGAVTHPLVADLDDDVLRVELLAHTRRLLSLPA